MKTRTQLVSIAVCALVALAALSLAPRAERAEAAAAPAPKAVAAGQNHTCALTAGGGVRCWGSNVLGQLGDGTTTKRNRPVDVCASGSGSACAKLTGVVALSAGGGHTCALTDIASVKCWGENNFGQLGDGTATDRVNPVDVCVSGSGPGCPKLDGVLSLDAGADHSCAVLGTFPETGSIKCWGGNDKGQLGNGTVVDLSLPGFVCESGSGPTCSGGTVLSGAVSASASAQHTCARLYNGEVRCWGSRADGRLGDGVMSASVYSLAHPVCTPAGSWDGASCSLGNFSGVKTVETGEDFTCALMSDGRVRCWGNNDVGQLGDGTTGDALGPSTVCSSGTGSGCSGGSALTGVIRLSAGQAAACVVLVGSGIQCWGNSNVHPVDGTGNSHLDFVSVSTYLQRCGLDTHGKLWCWASNSFGQVGNGTVGGYVSSPVEVGGFAFDLNTAFTGIGMEGPSCGRLASGSLKCWAENGFGQVGDGTATDRLNPVNVCASGSGQNCPTSGGFSQVASGGDHACGLTGFYPYGGAIRCWGNNSSGQLGTGTTAAQQLLPQFVCGAGSGAGCSGGYEISGFTQVVAGSSHTCGLYHTGNVLCWGSNAAGQLGDGTTTNRTLPVFVCDTDLDVTCSNALYDVIALAAGSSHTCALLVSGQMKCWGANSSGQLGIGSGSGFKSLPSSVCSSGFGGGCVIQGGITAVSAGLDHTCSRLAGGGAICWGSNSQGQIGDGTTTNRSNPVFVCASGTGSSCSGGSYLTSVADADAGGSFTCGRTVDSTSAGGVRCWGNNSSGQLGDGTTTDRLNPVYVCASGAGGGCAKELSVIEVEAGDGHACALTSAGRIRCWGANTLGYLGDGTTTNSSNPVDVVLALLDSDGDGCSDTSEMQAGEGSELLCGYRNPKNPYDYFNPSGDGLNRVDDILLVVQGYFDDDNDANPGSPPYDGDYDPDLDRNDDPDFDVTQPWRLLQGDGLIRVNDILNAVNVYFHDAS